MNLTEKDLKEFDLAQLSTLTWARKSLEADHHPGNVLCGQIMGVVTLAYELKIELPELLELLVTAVGDVYEYDTTVTASR